MHPTIDRFKSAALSGDESVLAEILAPDVRFRPPTYWATWTGREPVAAVLGHVSKAFEDFRHRRIMGAGADWALEFECRVGELNAVGVDLLTLDDNGLITEFEVVMRPLKSVAALREAMNVRVATDTRFVAYRKALSKD